MIGALFIFGSHAKGPDDLLRPQRAEISTAKEPCCSENERVVVVEYPQQCETSWDAVAWLRFVITLTIAATISFIAGRSTAPKPPSSPTVADTVRKVMKIVNGIIDNYIKITAGIEILKTTTDTLTKLKTDINVKVQSEFSISL